MPFWQPPDRTATRPRPRLLAENGRTGMESGPQPHIIASPPGTGAPIDRINYTPETGEVHPPGVLAPLNKLNYSLVPHDDLNYNGQLGQPNGAPPQGPSGPQGPAAGQLLGQGLQPQQPLQSNVWKNTGSGADIWQTPGTPPGVENFGRYSDNATMRGNTFSPGQPPLSPSPYGTGPGPQLQASGPTERPFDQRGSMVGNASQYGNASMGMGADDDGDGYDDETGEEVSPEDSIYASGGTTTQPVQPSASGSATEPGQPEASGSPPPTTAPAGYHITKYPPDAQGGGPPRDSNGRIVEQQVWLEPDQPGKARIPLGQYDAQTKPGTTERGWHPYPLQVQRSMSPDFAREIDKASTKDPGANHSLTTVVGSDGKQHRVLIDKITGQQVADLGTTGTEKPTTTTKGDTKIVGADTLHPQVLIRQSDGSWLEDEDQSAQLAAENAQKQQDKEDKDAADRQSRLDAAQAKPYTVYNDSSGQSWLVNTATGEKQKLGSVDPKSGVYESNGRLLQVNPDGSVTEKYKPPPGYDIHYDSYGRAIAVNKDDPSKTQAVYTPEDYDQQRSVDMQKKLADIEKSKADLATSKITQTDTRIKMMDALNKLEHPEARFIGSSDIYLPSGAAADVQRYNPETKTSTYEHVSGGDLSPEQKANAARMRSMMDEMDKALAGGDTNKANQIATQVQQSQTQPQQTQAAKPAEEQPGVLNLDAIQQRAVESPAGAVMKPGWPGEDPRLQGTLQPPTKRTTAAGDIASYDEHGVLTGIDYRNTAPPGYEGLGSTLQEGLDQGSPDEQPAEEEAPQEQTDQLGQDYWDKRRMEYMGTGTDIPRGGQGVPEPHKPAGNPGYDTTPQSTPLPPNQPPPGAFPSAPGAPGASPDTAGGASDPASIVAQPGFNPLNPPDLAALGPPGGGGGTAPGIMPGAMPSQPGALPNTDDPLFAFAMQRRQSAQAPMGGGADAPAQPNGSSYAGWTPPVPEQDVAGIGHRFGQPMNVGEPFHSGVDLQAVEGTPTISPVDGVVQRVEYNPQGLGITVILQGKDGTTHKLGHLKETSAYPGLVVSQGQDLQSQVGSTGNTTGSHLHWAVKTPDGNPTDPTASLGAMASLPPVPGTQQMGPPGGSGAPTGGAPPPGAPPTPAATQPVPAPPPGAAQGVPPSGPPGQMPPQQQGMGGGQDDLQGLMRLGLGAGAEPGPNSPFRDDGVNPHPGGSREERAWDEAHRRYLIRKAGEAKRNAMSDEDLAAEHEANQADEERRADAAAHGERGTEWWEGQGEGSREVRDRNQEMGRPRMRRSDELNNPNYDPVNRGYREAVDRRKAVEGANAPAAGRAQTVRPPDPNQWPDRPEAAWQRDEEREPWGADAEANRAARQARDEKFQQAREANQKAWAPKGVANPTPAPDKTGKPLEPLRPELPPTAAPKDIEDYPRPGESLDQFQQRLVDRREAEQAAWENRDPAMGMPGEFPDNPDLQPKLGRTITGEPAPYMREGELEKARREGRAPSYTAMTKEEVDRYNAMGPDELKQFGYTVRNGRVYGSEEEADDYEHNQQSGYNDAVKRGDSDAALRSLQKQGYTQEDLDESNPYTQWMREDKGKSGWDIPNKSVSPPLDLGGGHKPPVGPDPRDLIGKPGINVLPGPLTGGHVPVPLPDFPQGHVPGPEITLPDVTDKLPDWWPGKSQPGNPIATPPPEQPGPTDQGTPEDYSDLLERLRQLGQTAGAGADANAEPTVPAATDPASMDPQDIIALLEELIARLQATRSDSGMGAGLQLGPVHLSTSMRPPMRMPSSRMETSRRAGWTPRGGGMKRRPSLGTSAVLNV